MITKAECETCINMDRLSDKAKIYTSEKTLMRKLDKFVEETEDWKVVEIGRCGGEIVSKTYEAPKDAIRFRKKKPEMSQEQRVQASERLKAWSKNKEEEFSTNEIEEEEAETAANTESSDVDDLNQNVSANDAGTPDGFQQFKSKPPRPKHIPTPREEPER